MVFNWLRGKKKDNSSAEEVQEAVEQSAESVIAPQAQDATAEKEGAQDMPAEAENVVTDESR